MPRFYYGFKLFGALVARGLRGVQLVISDAHTGLRKGIRGVLNGVAWQRCTVHFMRNVLCRVPKAAQGFAAAALQSIFAQGSQKPRRRPYTKPWKSCVVNIRRRLPSWRRPRTTCWRT